ncbi:unnamed protein product [Lactuca saligna]|uniref:Uncharacterized protein n=1 Tax=Lactuca saligna TaxID=75948 RepID=A0AA35Z4C9_LACSI|nr:unnamed protein product [Lactuca saligna]
MVRFGKFVEVEETLVISLINVEIVEEHVASKPKFQFAFEEVEVSDDEEEEFSSERVLRPAPDANLDSFLSFGPITAHERREKQIKVDQLKGKMLVMKHSDQNAPGDHLETVIKETGKKFTDKYGECSGILIWGYDADKKMWIVKRKSGRIEYYEKKVDFLSWTGSS